MLSFKLKYYLLYFTGAFFLSCEKINYYPDKPLTYDGSLIIAHRGGSNDTLRDNSLEACIYGLSATGGIEVDIQISRDWTIWLSHSSDVESCAGNQGCFAQTRDEVIQKIDSCNGKDINYTTLQQVMQYMHQNNILKPIAIDLKGWGPCSGSSLDIEGIMRLEVEEVIKLARFYGLEEYIFFESEIPTVLTHAKEKSDKVKTYINSYGDFEKGMLEALKYELHGISFKSHFADELDSEKIELLHRKGIRLMAWNVPDTTYRQFLTSIHVDYIQFDL
jgi:glycerophosphoryl diester phosphodiesterase